VLLIFLTKSSCGRIKSCESCELIPSFIEWYPVSLNDTQFCSLESYTQIGESMKKGLQDETRAQRQGDFTDNFNTFYFLRSADSLHKLGSREICVPLQLAGDSGTKIGKRTALLGCKI
jgi:hypothetical protein